MIVSISIAPAGQPGNLSKSHSDKYEDYTAHVRVFWALRKAGYRITDKIVIVTRYNAEDQFEIEKDISVIGLIQKKLDLFQREIISIYEPVDEIIAKLHENKSANFMEYSFDHANCRAIGSRKKKSRLISRLYFLPVKLFQRSKKNCLSHIWESILSICMARWNLHRSGLISGFQDRFTVFPNSNYFEFDRITDNDEGKKIGNVVITNLINKTMPFIRYDLNDLAEIDEPAGVWLQIHKKNNWPAG